LSLSPNAIMADESVSALDVSVRAWALGLLQELQDDLGISYLFISHDVAMVEEISHRVAVIYPGQIVEIGSRRRIFESPVDPYTRHPLAAVPVLDPSRRRLSASSARLPQQSGADVVASDCASLPRRDRFDKAMGQQHVDFIKHRFALCAVFPIDEDHRS
jgi:ABC-type oligopeptide transport system ATPase subunit